MKAARVHSALALALVHPGLLARWRADPESLRSLSLDPAQFDLEALWKFAGLTAKVRHSGLRVDLPSTFRLLNVAGLEIEVFASFAASRDSGGGYAETTEARTDELMDFLGSWLDLERREHALLWDVIRHEVTLASLRELGNGAVGAPDRSLREPLDGQPSPAALPRLCGTPILHEMCCDPRVLETVLADRAPRLHEVPRGVFHFCYWRPPGAREVRLLQLDELGFYLLSMIDGTQPVRELSMRLGAGDPPPRLLLEVLERMVGLGIVRIESCTGVAGEAAPG